MGKKVLVIGELNIDMIFNHIKGFPEIGEEKISQDLTTTLGSSSAIFAANLSSLGTEVSYLGMIGKDDFGAFIIESLCGAEVETKNIITSEVYKTGVTMVLNYEMDRAMVTYPGAMADLGIEHINANLISQFDHVHISSIFLQPKIKAEAVSIFKLIKELGLTTSLDPQWDPEEQWDLPLTTLLPYVDIFLPNKKELLALTASTTIEEGLESLHEFTDRIIIKDGDQGAHYFDQGNLTTIPAFVNPQVVDCIGAGDSFDAGFVHKYIQGESRPACLQYANLIGALNTTEAGGTGAFQSREKMNQTAKNKFAFTTEI